MTTMLDRITTTAQSDILAALQASAVENAAHTNGLLKAYPIDLERFPYQSLSVNPSHMRVDGSPLEPVMAHSVVGFVDKRAEGLHEVFSELDETTGVITNIANVLKSGQNAAACTDHSELVDVALFGAALSATLKIRGAPHRSGIIVSKAIDFLGVDIAHLGLSLADIKAAGGQILGLTVQDDGTVPVRDFLGLGFDEQYLSVPNTQTFAGLRDNQASWVNMHNKAVIRAARGAMSSLHSEPFLLVVAISGTKTKQLDTDKYIGLKDIPEQFVTLPPFPIIERGSDVDVFGRISDGVVGFLRGALSYACSARFTKGERPRVVVNPQPEALTHRKDILGLAEKLVTQATILDGKTVLYDIKGNLPTKKLSEQ